MAQNSVKLSTMVGKHFERCWLQMARNLIKLSTMFGEHCEICWPQMARNSIKLSTIVREHSGWLQVTRNSLNYAPWLEKVLKYVGLKWLEIHIITFHSWRTC